MNKLFTLVILFSGLIASAQDNKPQIKLQPTGEAIMQFDSTDHNFEMITQGSVVQHVFKFVNKGSAPLVISNVKTPCSCTSPSYSKEPIDPGDEGEITIQFNSTGKNGQFVKTISVHYNSEKSPEFITIKGNVTK